MFLPDAAEPRTIDGSRVVRLARNTGIVAVCYAAALRFTDEFLSGAALPPAFSVPGAILLVALLVTRPGHWWHVIGATLVSHWAVSAANGDPLSAILVSVAMNAVCALATAALSRRYVDRTVGLGAVRAMGLFILIALLAPAVCLLGPAALFQIDRLPGLAGSGSPGARAGHWAPWLVATLGYTLAYVTVVPATLAGYETFRSAFANETRAVAPWARLIEALSLATAVAAVSIVALGAAPLGSAGALALVAPLPLVLCAALRFRLAGAAWSLVIVAVVAMYGATTGDGPAAASSTGTGVVALQIVALVLFTPLLFLGASLDERQRAYSRVAHSEERYTLAARVARVFVVSYEPDSGVMDADPLFGSLLGLGPFELAQPGWWWRHVHPDDAPVLRKQWTSRPTDAGPELAQPDFRMVASDGRVRWFRNHSVVPRVVADQSRLIATMSDITDLKAAELAAEQSNRELAHVARTAIVGELAAALAHEIRQPLTAILINSQTAMRVLDAQPRDPEAVREILQQLAADGRRAGEVIQRMRAFAKKGELERGPIDLNAVVRDAIQLVRYDTIRRRVEIRFAPSHEPLIVVGDRVQLQQVALNLVLNALEALAGRLPESERLVTIESARAAPHTAVVTIRDTGPGVPVERQEAIFAPFVTSKPNGLGMGLAISRTIVEAHGGVVWCEGDPSAGGATFIVAIPLGMGRP